MAEYEEKRRFEETPEPEGTGTEGDVDPLTAPTGDSFVIQQHYATRLHHDVRLEMLNGDTPVLVSWAAPKGLPRQRGERHLAIRTEDHPFEYGTFEGSIPEGNYGAGEVRIFDHGTYESVARTDDRLTFRLHGARLAGTYHLIKTGMEDDREQWLTLLSEDHRPEPDEKPPLRPMLATLVEKAFDNSAWSFEPKWDGIRALAMCDVATTLVSRNGNKVTAGYPELEALHDRLVAIDAILDGEIVAFEDGRPSFQRLQGRMHVRDARRLEQLVRSTPVVFMAFDLLYLDGVDLTGEPFTERRRRMEETVVASDHLQLSPVVAGSGEALYEAARDQSLEGIIAKRNSSVYETGKRSRSWLKIKLILDADVVIVGWSEGEGRRSGGIGSLVMAVYEEDGLRYVGNVGTGFDRAALEDAAERLSALATSDAPFDAKSIRSNRELRGAHWAEPSLVAHIEHRELTAAGKLRAPAFKGFRDDKDPRECTFDQLTPTELP
ncbi:MAG TPA: non-homologous end-joining DNA ligase [Acidimicrobiia bacterium]|nr:non-homologous end-joining DNA ligase [Acidimicrobiia bacterium]